MPGFVDNPYRYMRRVAVVAMSSRYEGLPSVLVEAMACGTPVVSSECGSGPREILDGGRYGRLVAVGNAEQMAAALAAALDEKPDSLALIARAEAFRAEAIVGHYLDVLRIDPSPSTARATA